MTSREIGRRIAQKTNTGGPAFWTGHPSDATVPLYAREWRTPPEREALFAFLKDDCRWIQADSGYRHPQGRPAFDPAWNTPRGSLSAAGCFAGAESVADIESYPWPDPDYCDFSAVYEALEEHGDKLCFTGMWSCFFHIVSDFFGMENYFIRMYENPKLVDAVTERVVDFFVEANERFFDGLGDRADVMFFGNDFGTQRDLFLSPELFRRFVLPSVKRLAEVGKRHGKIVATHSCGAIGRIIPDLIDAGIDLLHPLQARAAGMDAVSLAPYKHDLAFMGGIDAQGLMVDGTPDEVRREAERVWDILGPNVILSPSHEEILPNVPAANLKAISDTVQSLRDAGNG